MKRIKLNDFTFLGSQIPSYRRTYRSIDLTLMPKTARPPLGVMMVAVSGALRFLSTIEIERAKEAEAGVILYHTDQNYITVGTTASDLVITTVTHGWKQEISYPFLGVKEPLKWQIQRSDSDFTISVQENSHQMPQSVGTFTVAGTERSVSFGWYAANDSALNATVAVTAFTYQHTH